MINVIKDTHGNKDLDERHLKRRDLNNSYFVKEYLKQIKPDFSSISSVEIETHSGCNGRCEFCPVSINNDLRPVQIMTGQTFKRIIDELRQLNYVGYISYFSNNEPLLDKDIIDRINYGVENLPRAYHSLFTNGKLLTPELFESLTKNLNLLCIDNYDNNLQLKKNIKKLLNKEINTKCEVFVHIIRENSIRDSRAGYAPNRKDTSYSGIGACLLPFTQLIFKPNGDLTLCCQDALGEVTFGNINNNSLEDILNNSKRKKILSTLSQGRKEFWPCKRCDLFGMVNYNMNSEYKELVLKAFANLLTKLANDRPIYIHTDLENSQIEQIKEILKRSKLKIISKYTKECFTLFPIYDDNLLDFFDSESKYLGKDYLIGDIVYYLYH